MSKNVFIDSGFSEQKAAELKLRSHLIYLKVTIFAAFLVVVFSCAPAWFPDTGQKAAQWKLEREIERNLSALTYATVGIRQPEPCRTLKAGKDEKTVKAISSKKK